MNIVEYADQDMLAIDVANALAGELETALFNHDRVSLAVLGGSTPGPIFDTLCAVDLEWARVHVIPTDERWVEAGHPRANARLIAERFLVDHARAARFVPLWKPGLSPEEAAPDLAREVEERLPLSIAVLGMGADMHTASLFPGAEGLAAALRPDAPAVIAMPRVEGQPEPRISLSARVLDAAISKHLIIVGDAKRKALEHAATLSPEQAPIAAVLDDLTVHWAA